jgi:zinc protease
MYKTTTGNDPENMAISVLLNILINNQSSRVKQELQKNQQLIIETGAFPYEIRVPGFALLYIVPASMEHLEPARQAFDAEIEKIISEGVTQEELDIVKKAVLKSLVFAQKDKATMSTSVAVGALQYGDPEMYRSQLTYLAQLTVEDIQRVAAKYFKQDNRVVGNIIPIN